MTVVEPIVIDLTSFKQEMYGKEKKGGKQGKFIIFFPATPSGIWGLSSLTRIQPVPPAVEM